MATDSLLIPKYYTTDEIPENHWSIQLDPKFGVGTVTLKNGMSFWIKINPTDKRGYRLIIQFVNEKDMKSTLNRQWTIEETSSLFQVASTFTKLYYDLNLIPQIYYAGNNSMELEKGKSVLIGKKEPSMLHVHLLGRGNPDFEYLPGQKLKATFVGEEFNLKGTGDVAKNEKKVPWEESERIIFKSLLTEFIEKCINDQYFVSFKNVK